MVPGMVPIEYSNGTRGLVPGMVLKEDSKSNGTRNGSNRGLKWYQEWFR